MFEVNISEFRAKCHTLLKQARKAGERIRITEHGRPVAELVPLAAPQDRSAWIGSMKHSMQILGDIVSPANNEGEWEALRD